MANPFINVGYVSPLYFCDREEETSQLLSTLAQNRNITLHSFRRMGKTGLIQHIFHHLRKKSRKWVPIYVDIYDTKNSADFVNALISKSLAELEKKQGNFIKKVGQFFSRYRPSINIDSLTGNPSIYLDIRSEDDVKISLKTLFSIIAGMKKQVVIAIDEFQQIEQYPDHTIAATIRKYLQEIPNLTFIFSGSQNHLLLNLFGSPKKALFSTTQLFALDKISIENYQKFIQFHFKQGLKPISLKLTQEITTWTKRHTYYTQTFCQRLYGMVSESVTMTDIEKTKIQLMKEQEAIYYNYRSLLSPAQWKLLLAIGKADTVDAPTSASFISTYGLGSHSTVRQSLATLLQHELIYATHTASSKKPTYQIYDVFLSRWLQHFG